MVVCVCADGVMPSGSETVYTRMTLAFQAPCLFLSAAAMVTCELSPPFAFGAQLRDVLGTAKRTVTWGAGDLTNLVKLMGMDIPLKGIGVSSEPANSCNSRFASTV